MSRPPKKTATVRLNMELTARTAERLDWLQQVTEASSMAEVIRRALTVYEVLLKECRDGTITIRRANGEELSLLLIP